MTPSVTARLWEELNCGDFAALVLTGCGGHYARYLTEDFADAARHVRHYCTCRNRHKPRHQGILNQVLSVAVCPDSQDPDQIDRFLHCLPPIVTYVVFLLS